AQKISDNQGCPRAKDYDDTAQELISIANTWYRCLLATQDAFPGSTAEPEMVNLAWDRACEELKVAVRLTPDIAKLIMRRGSQMRGVLKTKVRALVELIFGFESGQNKKIIRKNRQRAEDLKEGMGYSYKVSLCLHFHSELTFCRNSRTLPHSARESSKGRLVIQKSTNSMWFNSRRDEGAMHPELFGPRLPKPTLALVLTAIECSVDQWASGIKTDVPFTAADYRSVYLEHIRVLEEFEKATAPRRILDNILTRLHNIGRQVHFSFFHSGAQPISAVKKAGISSAVLEAAILEYDEDENTESDGEDGERSDT
ncbi:hypothetical protein B0H17DRAFT_948416, partial [Mycena rosella]